MSAKKRKSHRRKKQQKRYPALIGLGVLILIIVVSRFISRGGKPEDIEEFVLANVPVSGGGKTLVGAGTTEAEIKIDAPFSMNIRFDDEMEILSESDTKMWRWTDEDGVYHWDEEKVRTYFQSLADKYDTPYGEVAFTTHAGTNRIISSDNCGWHMNLDLTIQNLKYALDQGSTTMDPCWNSGLVYSSKNGVGNKYVEVDMTNQMVYLYEDGVEVFSTPCVTGQQGLYDTHKGVYQIDYKVADTTLKGEDAYGNKYEQPVSYWMPFNGSEGLHDAPWRGSFGDNVYQVNGSHGCVNLPPDAAAKIFQEVYTYFPVVLY